MSLERPTVFFDGVCNLCNGFVDWLMRHDKEGVFQVGSLQGETAKSEIPTQFHNLDSMLLLLPNSGIYRKSDGVLMVLDRLGRWKYLSKPLRIFPRFLRDFVYDFIARNRYRIYGQRDTCRLPTAEERARFVD